MDRDQKILQRIKNLLNMAGDASSPHEAMIAMRRARFLMDKHQIHKEDLMLDSDNLFGVMSGEFRPHYVPTWIRFISAEIAYLNDCQSILVRGGGMVTFEFRGFKADAITAKYMHDYLIDACNRLLAKTEITGRSNKNFYRLGFAREIGSKIRTIMKKRQSDFRSSDGKSLIIIKKELVNSHFDILKKSKAPNVRLPNAYEIAATIKGAEDAASVSLDRQIESEKRKTT